MIVDFNRCRESVTESLGHGDAFLRRRNIGNGQFEDGTSRIYEILKALQFQSDFTYIVPWPSIPSHNSTRNLCQAYSGSYPHDTLNQQLLIMDKWLLYCPQMKLIIDLFAHNFLKDQHHTFVSYKGKFKPHD